MLKYTVDSQEKVIDLRNATSHILLARGNAQSSGKLEYHEQRVPSAAAVDFQAISKIEGEEEGWAYQGHAICMVLAWMSSAASGMLLARYYKATWRTVRPGDKDLWFRLHQMFMSMTVGLTMAGIIIILVDVGLTPWESLNVNPHPVFGLIAIMGSLIQPVMSMLRPEPDSSKRWIFNWAHWGVGNIAFGAAIVAIFFGVEYPGVMLPKEVTYVLIAYVVVHTLIHLVLSFQRVYILKNGSNQVKDIGFNANDVQDAPGSDLRKALAFVYVGLVWIFALVIVGWLIHQKLYGEHDHEEHDHEEH